MSVREAALAAGEARYSTGVPCRRGHVGERYTSCGACIDCMRLKTGKLLQDRGTTARAVAISRGDATYDTGKPCRRGHRSPMTISGGCRQCHSERWLVAKHGELSTAVRGDRLRDELELKRLERATP